MATTDAFFEQPILNSPYECPSRHWELDASGQPTNKILDKRRKVAFITPIPKPKKRCAGQREMVFDEAAQALGTEAQQYDLTAFIDGVRQRVDRWRELPDPGSWQVTPETARLLKHWRNYRFGDIRPFFCQVAAVETAIWRQVLEHLDQASEEANPGLARRALKLATGALPEERLTARFNDDSTLELTPALVGPSVTRNEGIIGEGVDLNLVHTRDLRRSTLLFHLTKRLLETKWQDPGEEPKLHLFDQLKRITRQWLDDHLVCKGDTYPAQLMYQELADMACEQITAGIVTTLLGERPIKAVLGPYNPVGSSS